MSFARALEQVLDGKPIASDYSLIINHKEVMRKGKVDVVICTKNRQHLLFGAVEQVRKKIPYNRIIIVDSSGELNAPLLKSLGVEFYWTPDVLLGVARQKGLTQARTELVAVVDDDLVLAKDWFARMYSALLREPTALAVSGKVVFGYKTDKVLEKIHTCSLRGEGASVGVALFKRRQVLALGGFNVHTHRGEDTELELRMKSKGYRWIREQTAVAYHPLTMKEYMRKAVDNVDGWMLIWNHSNHRVRFLIERTGAFLFMPVYYGLLTRSMKAAYYYFRFKGKSLFTFLWRVNQK